MAKKLPKYVTEVKGLLKNIAQREAGNDMDWTQVKKLVRGNSLASIRKYWSDVWELEVLKHRGKASASQMYRRLKEEAADYVEPVSSSGTTTKRPRPSNSGIANVTVKGDEDQVTAQFQVEAILSAYKRLHLPFDDIARDAVENVKRM